MVDFSASSIFVILISAILVNNFVLSRFLGICPFLGVSKQVETSFGMGMAVTFVMALASIMTYLIQHLVLVPLELQYMQTITFILVIASIVQLVEMIIQKVSPTLYQSLGVFLPLITTNCAVLGLTILNIQLEYNIIETTFHAIGAAVGFTLVIVLFAAIRERLEVSNVPEAFKGFAIALVTAGLMSMAFLGFSGLV
ncbi:electron transport complex, RnfABCDGE type, A subunit [Alkaliphilus metalliredigens QYMF]|uniref:Ion-translocating oxidoreductase complex subunit A n=1 Tax=Alkaliphilus metalliredigens (strain QYMF) TaxID=293826 RepID=A6TQH3_ALKMQ|nr:electron transport complex subunit RsxA [Alkaliphilus metalliredigens]ABR48441.1 electron transport complex, RnfABCDGE type, A subunit [Alkaliphilus metalliredigens QYMF]